MVGRARAEWPGKDEVRVEKVAARNAVDSNRADDLAVPVLVALAKTAPVDRAAPSSN